MAFDRLIHAVDRWARQTGRTDVFAQIGESDAPPEYIRYAKFLTISEFRQRIAEADLVIAHAGTGSILDALAIGKPILIMPRQAKRMETRNDHQIATAHQFKDFPGVSIAMDENALSDFLFDTSRIQVNYPRLPKASGDIIDCIRSFIHGQSKT